MTSRAQDRVANLAYLADLADIADLSPDTPETSPTVTEWATAKGAHERHRATVFANPIAKAAYDRTTERINARARVLREIRKARALTQAELGQLLGMDQSEVSRLEQRTDLLLSTLRRFVAATGGELHLIATYPDTEPINIELADTR